MKIENVIVVCKNSTCCEQIIDTIYDNRYRLSSVSVIDVKHHSVDLVAPSEQTLVIAVGGDGTMLRAMSIAARSNYQTVFVLGVYQGTLGFLTDFTVDEFEQVFNQLLDGKFSDVTIDTRSTIYVNINGKTFTGINEVVVASNDRTRPYEYRIQSNEIDVGYFRADGIIVATPTGSTAYGVSAGGCIIDPSMQCIEVIAIAPHTLASRPIVFSCDDTITIGSNQANQVIIDGIDVGVSLEQGNNIIIRGIEHNVNVIHKRDWNFFAVLEEKMQWTKQ